MKFVANLNLKEHQFFLTHPVYTHTCSGVARVIVWEGGEVVSGKGSLVGPPPNFYTDLDFSNGLEHNWGGGRSPPLNYATAYMDNVYPL